MTRGRQRGFTLIELMIALVVSSLLVGLILAIFSRMSLAYRGQQQIAGVQQVIAAARATIEIDAKQAGLGMPQGFRVAFDPTTVKSPVQVVNGNPDQIALFYADTTTQAAVASNAGWPASLVLDAATGFAPGDFIVLSTANISNVNTLFPAEANIVTYSACILEIATVSGNQLTFVTAAPWGLSDQHHCTPAPAAMPTNPATMVYKAVAHGYRIDPARPADGVLQQSPTGGLFGTVADAWSDLAYGFTDLQVALRVYNSAGAVDLDGDGDATRNWVSGGSTDLGTSAVLAFPGQALLQASISLVARTDREIEGISTRETPDLTDAAHPNNNALGDHAKIVLGPTVTDPALQGNRIYRYATFQVDFRNLGVGR
jgi:prepilin-type N-terminal cleavage/methylation domain-containing protein